MDPGHRNPINNCAVRTAALVAIRPRDRRFKISPDHLETARFFTRVRFFALCRQLSQPPVNVGETRHPSRPVRAPPLTAAARQEDGANKARVARQIRPKTPRPPRSRVRRHREFR
jgi:hypothetical protein